MILVWMRIQCLFGKHRFFIQLIPGLDKYRMVYMRCVVCRKELIDISGKDCGSHICISKEKLIKVKD